MLCGRCQVKRADSTSTLCATCREAIDRERTNALARKPVETPVRKPGKVPTLFGMLFAVITATAFAEPQTVPLSSSGDLPGRAIVPVQLLDGPGANAPVITRPAGAPAWTRRISASAAPCSQVPGLGNPGLVASVAMDQALTIAIAR